ncbi:MAG: hypothetical protein QOD81_989 [Solirubrobacteraceae bacterium]|jgi:hypothetical protein|nr:hypothetical protein [Solirubrobacteraceae bacterium]
MTFTKMPSSQCRSVLDEAMDAYVDWRQQCIAVSNAYAGWTAAQATDAALAFAVYVAALHREERAAQVYGSTIRRVGDLVPTDGELQPAPAASGAGRHGR